MNDIHGKPDAQTREYWGDGYRIEDLYEDDDVATESENIEYKDFENKINSIGKAVFDMQFVIDDISEKINNIVERLEDLD